jgi:hypothetical protein
VDGSVKKTLARAPSHDAMSRPGPDDGLGEDRGARGNRLARRTGRALVVAAGRQRQCGGRKRPRDQGRRPPAESDA